MKQLLLHLLVLLCCTGAVAQNIDYRILKSVNHIDNRFIHQSTDLLSNSTAYISLGIPAGMGLYSLISKDEDLLLDAVYVGSTLCEVAVLSYGLKHITHRERPYNTYNNIICRDEVQSSSFPSGHTSAAFSVATALSITYPKWYVIAPSFLWAGGVGFARMYEGVHYPTDVLCGAVLGAGSAWLNYKLNQWMIRKYQPKKWF